MREFFKYLLRPRFWFSNEPTCLIWDRELNHLIDNAKEVETDKHTVKIDGVSIWTANYPYAYGNLYSLSSSLLPRRSTRERLRTFVIEHHLKNAINRARRTR